MNPRNPSRPLAGISSMATRQVVAGLARGFADAQGREVRFESIGGVDAARRIEAGEAFDVVVLAEDAMARLGSAGHVRMETLQTIVDSEMVVAVPEGAACPAIDSEAALREALLAAPRIGYSTGPSGTALMQLLARWRLREPLAERLVQMPPGVPVGRLLAAGQVELGFQQYSELFQFPGVCVLGGMPPGFEIVTRFAGAIGRHCHDVAATQRLLDYMVSPATRSIKQRHGMDAPRHSLTNP